MAVVNRSQKRGAVIVTPSGCYLSHWAAKLSFGFEWDDSYHYVPEFTEDPSHAYVYEDERSARRAILRIQSKSGLLHEGSGSLAVVS